MKIYTKTGDLGQTRLIGGQQVFKNDLRIQAYGNVDELNSLLGIIVFYVHDQLKDELIKIQHFLFNLGSHLAAPNIESKKSLPQISDENISELENKIDAMEALLPTLKNFIIPGGTNGSCHLHLARTVCRRSERSVVELLSSLNACAPKGLASTQNKNSTSDSFTSENFAVRYLNRLSDYLFVLARYDNFLNDKSDQIWDKNI